MIRDSGLADAGTSGAPSIVGIDGPNTSASRSPTFAPWRASASARFTATVDLPTPPLPAATAITFRGPFRSALSLGAGRYAVTISGTTLTRLAPRPRSASSIRLASSRRCVVGYACVGMSTFTSTSSPETSTPRSTR